MITSRSLASQNPEFVRSSQRFRFALPNLRSYLVSQSTSVGSQLLFYNSTQQKFTPFKLVYFIHLVSYDFRFYFSALVAVVFLSGIFFLLFISITSITNCILKLAIIICHLFSTFSPFTFVIIIMFRNQEFFHDSFSNYGTYRTFLIFSRKTSFV